MLKRNLINKMKVQCVVSCMLLLFGVNSHAGDALNKLYGMSSAAIVLVDTKHRELIAKQASQALIPASTVKLLTALVALEHWGRKHQFKTEFYLDKYNHVLIVRGLGDPFLISEELDVIVAKIKDLGITRLENIIADDSYFDYMVNLSDRDRTNNPYDAVASALAVNFNTIELEVSSAGVKSGEAQTPLTPMAKHLASGLPAGKHRINLGSAKRSPEYFIQVLSAKLRNAGVVVDNKNEQPTSSLEDTSLLFTHSNTRPLEQIVQAMLEYSNNFIASQLFLLLGIEQSGSPASLQKSRQMLAAYVARQFNWQNYVVEDGSGLSRSNQLSAHQLVDVLDKFASYRDLMPQQSQHIFAKSGTLKGVSCYAGYVFRNNEWQTFALLINQPVQYRFREQVAEELLNYDG